MAAAFRRLCVETVRTFQFVQPAFQPPSGGCVLKQGHIVGVKKFNGPAAFRRLCVETFGDGYLNGKYNQPPSGGCVLKQWLKIKVYGLFRSRLQAAVC